MHEFFDVHSKIIMPACRSHHIPYKEILAMILIRQFGKSLHDRQIKCTPFSIVVYASMGLFLYSNQNHQFKMPPTMFSEQTATYNVLVCMFRMRIILHF